MSKIIDESILVFSLKILSGSFLHFVGITVFIVGYMRNVKSHFFCKTGHSGDSLTTGMSRELTAMPNCPFLSCSAPTIVTLQLPTYFTCMVFWQVASRILHTSHVWHFGESLVTTHLNWSSPNCFSSTKIPPH